MLRDAVDPKLPLGIGELPYKTERVDNSFADLSLLQHDTGFSPNYSFIEGIAETVAYFREKEKE
jgi:nucleoside-diphosphate-sugar epimerase